MRIARFEHAGQFRWGVVEGAELRVVGETAHGMRQLFGEHPTALANAAARASTVVPLEDAKLLPPVDEPSKIIGIGLNYRDHAAESNLPLPTSPMMFAKFPSSLVGASDAIVLPSISKEVDWEVELAIVIGREGRHLTEERALDHVVGYTVANDVSARDLQVADGQFVRAKSFDTFCPLGPWITTVDELDAADDLRISLDVGERTMQDSRTSEMVFGVRELVAFCSSVATLLPGDLILSGTPHGTGYGLDPQVYLAAGDEVTARIEGIGTLSNRVRSDDD